jgi:hypothetical protein
MCFLVGVFTFIKTSIKKYTLAVAQAGVETHSLATAGNNTTFVVHHNTHIPYMPSELRHTNYGSKTQLIHPQVNL